MTSPAFPSRPAQECGTPSIHVVPRGESVLLTVDDGNSIIQIAGGRLVKSVSCPLAVGHTALVAAGTVPLTIRGSGLVIQRVPADMLRLLAFHDHAQDLQRDSHANAQPCVQLIRADLQRCEVARHWLMVQLQQRAAAFDSIAARWARHETYQLVRFVLQSPDASVQQLATRYGLSVAQFRRLSRKAFDRSLKEQLRLMRAGRVLLRYADTGESFTRLSSDFGFSSPSHFCCEIKALLGKAPSSIFRSVIPS